MELPPGAKYKVYKTKKYTIYYLLDNVELKSEPERRIVSGGHEFLYFGNTIVIRPIESSQAREAP
ncbi:hypothetical protein [Pyrobaculum aerophilum]|uniref:Uncharacterized protein n=1 Tax=Pyrobaculum aerophilum TaxID=13773 RepID=A0A832STP0_9CREN|nr:MULTISPECIES: hypothetical protein [Pyrobaculum]MCX8136313.1 hypothetical protein [Pyrobaculum aerophilum]HII47588.1 hypothetical protein [Pyrobaculum aerophilum]